MIPDILSSKREILLTADGSHTVALPGNITYHSVYGAIQESRHVYIQAGLEYCLLHMPASQQQINILEMGFGTGLNAILSLQHIRQYPCKLYYQAVELYPLSITDIKRLNYAEQLHAPNLYAIYNNMHGSAWGKDISLNTQFTIHKSQTSITTFTNELKFNLIYFDAFAPDAQPELWETNVFRNMYALLETSGILVTYCSKGAVRRNLISCGFAVEKLPGPPGKREILRAIKA